MAMLEARAIQMTYTTAAGELSILRDAALVLEAGDSASIMGPSGSGKSTLLNILGTLERPTGGSVRLDGTDPFALGDRDLAVFRSRQIGFIFQEHHLLPQCTVLENALLPTLAHGGNGGGDPVARARELLERVGLGARIDHRPSQLSGGERQRVAIARALVNQPQLVLADEPTGSLDTTSAGGVVDLLFAMHEQEGGVLVMVTHNSEVAARAGRHFELQDGTLVAGGS